MKGYRSFPTADPENGTSSRTVFDPVDIAALQLWPDRIIEEIETRTNYVLCGSDISEKTLPRCATIGLKLGEPDWASNHPRPRMISHIVQAMRPPTDWTARWRPRLEANEAWAVDPFLLAKKAN